MSGHKFFNNFTGGVWTPKLDGRSDIQKYDTALRVGDNIRIMQYGGATLRPGFGWVAELLDGANFKSFLVPFQFSTTTRILLIFSNFKIYFASDEGILIPDQSIVTWDNVTAYSSGTVVRRPDGSGGWIYWKALNNISLGPTNPTPETTPADWALARGDEYGLNITSPWAGFTSVPLQYKQINDVMYITTGDDPVYKLTRVSDTSWTLAEVEWTYPPFRDENVTDTTLTASATTGTGVTLTASSGIFTSDHVGSYWEVRHLREASSAVLNISASSGTVTSSALTVKGDWELKTSNYWYGTLQVQRSEDGGTTWETIREFQSQSDRNVSASGTQITEAQLRLRYTATGDPLGSGVWAGTAPTDYVYAKATLEVQEAYVGGFVKVTAFTSDTEVTVDVKDDLESTAATKIWAEGAFSAERGYPRAVGLYEQRLWFGGIEGNPIGIWGSKTDDFENFEYGVDDDDAVAFGVAATESNIIQWLEGLQVIQAGTSGGEFTIASGSAQSEPITPSNVSVRGQSAYGSAAIQAKAINDVVLFVNRQGTRIHEMSYSLERDRYVGPDLTVLAEHLLEDGIVQMAFARLPDPTLYVIVNDGTLAVFTYNREQNITAWTRWTTDGEFESVATLYGETEDQVWVSVKRTINGVTDRHLEKLAATSNVKTEAVHLDSCITGTSSGGTITGLDHLEGETVKIVIDGAYMGEKVVSGGEVTADEVGADGNSRVGLGFTGDMKLMKLDVVMQDGASQGKKRRISKAVIRFADTGPGVKFGRDESNLDEITFRDFSDNMDGSPPLFTGDKVVEWQMGHDREGTIIIRQDVPLPMTVLGVAVSFNFMG